MYYGMPVSFCAYSSRKKEECGNEKTCGKCTVVVYRSAEFRAENVLYATDVSDKKRKDVVSTAIVCELSRHMDTIERIEFLATLPNELRPVTCELKTKNKTYEGVIQTCDKKKVVFTLSEEEKTITIPLEHIVSVSLIGKS